MDIQKEREAFEAVTNIYHCIYNADFNYYFGGSKFVGGKAEIEVNAGWKAWQAAKAQSDKKIKLLLCDEHLQKCESPIGVFNSQYPDEEPCLICLAKQYKSQAAPEGFVVVPKEPTSKMLYCGYAAPDNLAAKYKAMIEAAQEPAND
ncbi:hypothetical protein [Acinetobacter indicus]|uniref:hypothetical protein n=1 Tax=Acinetobacter indicus TaxID=756892 RepID=UPI0014446F6D|nr:hypothetical protein [Acinetobacter indicus]